VSENILDIFIKEAEEKMQKSLAMFERELASIRTGRANPALIERVGVEYYGTVTPLAQLASISAPDPRLLVIQPWDKNSIPAIEKALMRSELALTPSNDGSVIRVPIPPLTEERRKEYVKLVKSKAEEAKVAIRNIRRMDAERIKAEEKKGSVSEDEARRATERLQKITDRIIGEIEEMAAKKEAEVLEV